MNRGQSKTAKARARRGIRKSADDAEVLDPDDPEFDAKLDASIERAYERIEAELDRRIEDLRSLPNRARSAKCVNPCVTHCVTKSCHRGCHDNLSHTLSPKYLRRRDTRACACATAGPPNRHCEHIVNTPVRIGTGSAREYLRAPAYAYPHDGRPCGLNRHGHRHALARLTPIRTPIRTGPSAVERLNPGSTLARTRAMAFRVVRLNPTQH